jgi:FtsH-binding integral membrane protein
MSDDESVEVDDANTKRRKRFRNKNYFFVACGLLLSVVSVLYYEEVPVTFSAIVIFSISFYLLCVIFASAILSSKKPVLKPICQFVLPSRVAGLLLFGSFLISLLFMWAGLYVHYCHEFSPEINGGVEASYFSYITMATVGYGDIHPNSLHAKQLVMWQISTSILLFFGAFPLLISRFATFNSNFTDKP